MTKQVEDIKVVEVNRIERTGQEFIIAMNQGEQKLELTRFPRAGEGQLGKDRYYRGYVSPKPPPDPNNPDKRRNCKFDLIAEISEFGGVEVPFTDVSDEMDARQKSILVQSDMRAAAICCGECPCVNPDDPAWELYWNYYSNVFETLKQFREKQEKM